MSRRPWNALAKPTCFLGMLVVLLLGSALTSKLHGGRSCSRCGDPARADDHYCVGCGLVLTAPASYCIDCGAALKGKSRTCAVCGEIVRRPPSLLLTDHRTSSGIPPDLALVNFTSTPPGAKVFCFQWPARYVGRTDRPMTLQFTPGTYRFKFIKAGYEASVKTVQVRSKGVFEVHGQLKALYRPAPPPRRQKRRRTNLVLPLQCPYGYRVEAAFVDCRPAGPASDGGMATFPAQYWYTDKRSRLHYFIAYPVLSPGRYTLGFRVNWALTNPSYNALPRGNTRKLYFNVVLQGGEVRLRQSLRVGP